MGNELNLHSISDNYIRFLREKEPGVYSNKEENRNHTRKYVGVVMRIGDFCYYIPMSSPKKTDYQFAGNSLVIKKSIIPLIRMVVKNKQGEKELKGTLRISHMIPVPESELELYDLENEKDLDYKELVRDQLIFIRKNKTKIEKNANILYKQKLDNDNSANYVKTALNYNKLEMFCKEYENKTQYNVIAERKKIMECVFCNKDKIVTDFVYEDEIVLAFMCMEPINEGHVLVVPKEHYLDVDEMPDEVLAHLMIVSKRIVSALKDIYKPNGYSIMQNGGVFNDVGHYHLHIFPRFKGDGFGWTEGEDIKDVNSEIAKRIRDKISFLSAKKI